MPLHGKLCCDCRCRLCILCRKQLWRFANGLWPSRNWQCPREVRARDCRLAVPKLNPDNVLQGNGMQGWAEDGPYNAIHVGASAAEIPRALLDQLAPGGRLVLPVGAPGDKQSLKVIDRDDKDGFYSKDMMGVQYVPLTSKEVQLRGGLLSGSVVVNS